MKLAACAKGKQTRVPPVSVHRSLGCPRLSYASPGGHALNCPLPRKGETRATDLLDQLVLDRVVRQIRVGSQIHLLEDARAVGTDRFHRKEQFVRDIRNAVARSQFAEHLEFARRQLFVRSAVNIAGECGGQLLRQCRTNVFLARQHHANSLEDLGRRTAFRDVSVRARLEHVHRVLFFGMHRKDQYRQIGTVSTHAAQHVDTASIRHRQVEKHAVNRLGP